MPPRSYLARQDLATILGESRGVEDTQALEAFLLRHGENMVDCLGAEVDRIEKNLKQKHPEVRHGGLHLHLH